MSKPAAQKPTGPIEPASPKPVVVEMIPEDWQHLLQFAQVGAQKLIDNIAAKANELTKAVSDKLPPPEKK